MSAQSFVPIWQNASIWCSRNENSLVWLHIDTRFALHYNNTKGCVGLGVLGDDKIQSQVQVKKQKDYEMPKYSTVVWNTQTGLHLQAWINVSYQHSTLLQFCQVALQKKPKHIQLFFCMEKKHNEPTMVLVTAV